MRAACGLERVTRAEKGAAEMDGVGCAHGGAICVDWACTCAVRESSALEAAWCTRGVGAKARRTHPPATACSRRRKDARSEREARSARVSGSERKCARDAMGRKRPRATAYSAHVAQRRSRVRWGACRRGARMLAPRGAQSNTRSVVGRMLASAPQRRVRAYGGVVTPLGILSMRKCPTSSTTIF